MRVMHPFSADGKARPLYHTGPSNFGMSFIKKGSADRVKLLLRVLNYIASPFSSQEWALLNYGVESVHFNRDMQGVPVLTEKGKAEVLSTWKYITNNPQVLYDTNRSQEYATNIQEDEKAMADVAIADPTLGLYSPTYSAQQALLDQAMTDGVSDIVIGRAQLSDLDGLVKDWSTKGGDKARIPLRARPGREDLEGLGHTVFRPVGAVRDHGMEGVRNRYDAGHHRDRRPLQLVGVTGPVPALVVMPDGRRQHGGRAERPGDLGAEDGVLLDLGKLLRRQSALLVEELLREADLADVMQEPRVVGDLLILGVETDQPRHRLGGERDAVVERRLGLGRVLPLDQFAQAFLRAVEVAPQFLEAKQRAHAYLEVSQRDRLDDQVIATRLDHLGALRPRIESGHHQHRDLGGRGVGLQSLAGLVTVHHGHLDVHQDQVWLELVRDPDRLLPVVGGFRPEAEVGELSGEQVTVGTAIVRDQDGPALWHRPGWKGVHVQ